MGRISKSMGNSPQRNAGDITGRNQQMGEVSSQPTNKKELRQTTDEKPTILILDDEPGVRKTLSRTLSANGYAPIAAANAKTALDAVKKQAPAVALIDLRLDVDDTSGMEVMQEIKSLCPGTECIVITAYSTHETAIRAVNLGAYGYLQKPYDLEHLLLMIRGAIQKREAKEKLRQQEAYFRSLIENSLDTIVILNSDGTIRYKSPSYEHVLGYKPEDGIGAGLLEHIHPDDVSHVSKAFAQMLQMPGNTLQSEVRAQHKDGSWRAIEAIGHNLLDDPVVEGIVVNMRDVTERKQAKEQTILSLKVLERANEGEDLRELIRDILLLIKEFSGFDAVGIRLREGEDFPYYETKGFSSDFVQAESSLCARDLDGQLVRDEVGNPVLECMCGNVICGRFDPQKPFFTHGGSFWTNGTSELLASTTEEDRQGRSRNRCNREGYESVALIPLKIGRDNVGLLQLNGRRCNCFTPQLINYYEGIGQSIGIVLARRQAEERVLRQSAMLDAINKMFKETLVCESEEEVAHTCLAMAEELTGSKFGFVGEVNQVGRFDTIALTDPGWDACKIPKSDAAVMIKDMNIRGIWARVLKDEKSQIVNDPASHPDTVGTPEGHPQLTSFLGVPLKHAGRTIGIIGLANKESGYDLTNQQVVENLSVAFVEALNRKRMEKALRQSQERLSGFMDSATDGFLLFDSELNLVEVNKGALGMMWGANREDVVGKNILELSPSVKQTGKYDRYVEVMQTGRPFYGDEISTGQRFGDRHLFINAFKAGEGLGIIITDITERKNMERELRESEDRLRRYLEYSPDIICVVGFKGTILYVNRATEKITGYSREDLLGKSFRKLPLLAPEHESKPAQWAERGGDTRPTSPDEFQLVKKDGSPISVEITTFPMGEGEKVEVIAIGRDITERKQLEEERLMMEQQLLLSGRLAAVGELAAGVAHELNNPLAAVQAYAQFLTARDDLEESIRGDVEIIYKEAQRAARITSNLLSFARKHEPEKTLISINDTIEKSLELHAYRLKVNNVEVSMELDPHLPMTMADFHQLQQVFANLITNAEQAMIEAHDQGKLLIKAQQVDKTIQISFADDGPGVAEDDLKRIFDPFFTTKDVGKGTGLGLSICYGIVQEHGGRLYAKSKPGKGTTFVVEIPIILEEQLEAELTDSVQVKGE